MPQFRTASKDKSTMSSFTMLLSVSMGLSGVMAVAGNILVITAIVANKKLRTPQNLRHLSLAMCDILVGVVSVPVMIYIYIQGLLPH